MTFSVTRTQHVLAVDDFESAVAEPIADKPWGLREFLVETPEGHRIKFGQDL